jgi:hypothetical protein
VGLREPDGRGVAAPGPVLGALAEARLDRVPHDVAERRQELVVVFDANGVVACAEDVSFHVVAHVERNSMAEVQRVHPDRKRAVVDVE